MGHHGHGHISNQIHHPGLKHQNVLHVIGVVSNPARFHSRYRLAREWIEAMQKTPNVKLHVVECAFGDREFEVTQPLCDWQLQLRTKSEIWNKESMINLGVRYLLPPDWKYVAWVDMDVFFRNPNWAQEALHQMQHHPVIQPWSEAIDLGPNGEALELHQSFCSLVAKGIRKRKKHHEPYIKYLGHPGYAWACTRLFYEQTYGLIDFAILGSGDHQMACAMINEVDGTINDGMSNGFKMSCREWQARAFRACKGNVGYVKGAIEHAWHGPKKNRFYCERWLLLTKHQYNPAIHLTRDDQGMIQLVPEMYALEADIRAYNRSRQEDSIDL